MEEILASIRKIISEDEEAPEAPVAGGAAEQAAPQDVLPPDVPPQDALPQDVLPEATVPREEVTLEDVLELTERVAEGDLPPEPASAQRRQSLVSGQTDSGVTSALADFAGALAAGKSSGTPLPGSDQTLDSLVLAALEPHLKNWLDENLEPLVERVVKEELKRMARRAEDDI